MVVRKYRDKLLKLLVLALVVVGTGCAHTDKASDESDKKVQADKPELYDDSSTDVINSLSEEEIAERQPMNIEQLLRGIAGVTVDQRADGSFRIRIRGERSIAGPDTPLYVVDGVPTQPMAGSGLIGLSVYDIKSIKVLKGSAAAIYGMRGANGVVVIETKEP